MVSVVTDVLVSFSSMVTEFCVDVSGEFEIGYLLNRSPLLSPESGRLFRADSQEEMRYEGSPVKSASVPE